MCASVEMGQMYRRGGMSAKGKRMLGEFLLGSRPEGTWLVHGARPEKKAKGREEADSPGMIVRRARGRAKANTGVLRFAQDDDVKQATASATANKSRGKYGGPSLRSGDDVKQATASATATAAATASTHTGILRLRASHSAQDDGGRRVDRALEAYRRVGTRSASRGG